MRGRFEQTELKTEKKREGIYKTPEKGERATPLLEEKGGSEKE